MTKSRLIHQEELLERARLNELVIGLFPLKFANGYFVKGINRMGGEMYSTINDEKRREIQYILNMQKQGGLKCI